MRTDLTDFLAPPRRDTTGDAGARAARDAARNDASPSNSSRDDDARPCFTILEAPDRRDNARANARNPVGGSAAQNARSGTSQAALMSGRGEAADASRENADMREAPGLADGSADPVDIDAVLRALAGEGEAENASSEEAEVVRFPTGGEGASDKIADPEAAGEDGAGAQPSGELSTYDTSSQGDAATGGSMDDEAVQEGAAPGDPALEEASKEESPAEGDDTDAGSDAAQTGPQIAATAASQAQSGSTNPVAGDASRVSRGNGPAAHSTAAQAGASQGNAAQAAAGDAQASEADAEGEGQGDGEGAGDDSDGEGGSRPGRGAGDENRSAVAQEALRRVLAGETGLSRAAIAPGNGEQGARHTAEQVARMMQAGAEALTAQSKGTAQAAAEASATANGQAAAASQSGTAVAQTNGSVLINTPLSAVPLALGMKAMGGASRFEIRLDPAELGRIAVRLDIDDEGTVKARLVVDRVETLQLLQRDARTLERAFEQAGLKPSEEGIDLSLRDDSDRHARDGEGDEDEGRTSGNGRERDGDESDKGLAAAEIRALARETLLARQALRRALGGVDLSI